MAGKCRKGKGLFVAGGEAFSFSMLRDDDDDVVEPNVP